MGVGKILVDTNVLMNNPDVLNNGNYVISGFVIRELEKLKQSENNERSYKARLAIRKIEENADKLEFVLEEPKNEFDDYDDDYIDNRILTLCKQQGFSLMTGDLLLKMKARAVGIEVVDVEEDEDNYKGYVEVYVTPEEINYINQNLDHNQWDLLHNQYLILKDDITDEPIDAFRWDGNCLIRVNQKGFTTMQFGKFKPLDFYQQCALDSLIHNQMTMIKGRAGSGKTLIALSYAWYQIEKGKYNKLVIFFNPVNAGKTSSKLGFYKGSKDEKLTDGQLGAILGTKFGDKSIIESYVASGKLVLYPFADIRGVDIQDSITLILEAQNLDKELMKIAIQRVSKTSKLIIDGDYNQVDASIFEGQRNGMRRVSQVFRGKEMYGEVELPIVYRSRIAEIAEQL
ncbi:PhoH-like phosphate starvation-inducible [Geobacillus virus E3]|uniref:PhoH-like phosphate starvation-inducible n=1 Tax=Geobacillus virus E3 TaxID=1572712 RepID=UPI0006719F27|nr:PhoH-like phosphate starvation-inducible [Geobacillus virus E3]AJA41325.1 PhoH-like protein [Geobacillus virus E3]